MPPHPRPAARLAGGGILARTGDTAPGAGVSKQGFAIYAKVAEVNRAMTPALQARVVEVHPEVGFWALAGGRPMAHAKGTPEGYEERRALLSDELGLAIWSRDEARAVARPAAPDDLLDAVVASWTARRWAAGASSSPRATL